MGVVNRVASELGNFPGFCCFVFLLRGLVFVLSFASLSFVHGWFLSDLYVSVVIFCHNFSVKLFNDNNPRVYCLKSLGSNFQI
jgi:hypothetical protein